MSANKRIFLSKETIKLRSIMYNKAITEALKADKKHDIKSPKDNVTKFEKKKDFK